MKGLFSFEGIDGSGKTTQVNLLSHSLKERGFDVLVCYEPGSTVIGESIRQILLAPERIDMAPLTELFLYSASRAQLLSEIVHPALSSNKVVILDRFSDSTFAYQGYGRGLDREALKILDRIVVKEFKPELTFFLDLDIHEARRRNKKALKDDRFEREARAFYQKVAQGYDAIAKEEPHRFKIINAQGKPEEIHKRILALMTDYGFFRH